MLPTGFSIWNVITPALVAALITLFYNTRAEKKRAERDFISKSFDTARDDVRRAVEAGVAYFPEKADERTGALEATLWMGERDVRNSVSALIEFSAADCPSRDLLQSRLDDFVDALTGGSFQSVDASADLDQARKVAATGARLRASISTARQTQLRIAITADPFSKIAAKVGDYMTENLGPERPRDSTRGSSTPP
jgi:hypothetical protein